ncbi:MAG: 4a-hydroxytetrahydrobiopterin dehydratase [Candidatus Saccharimonadales bacterium]|nr:4a-hydroxytetrahydrobiopterin dehydratase [Candidatus Saccharimonadales bacterium]
MSKLLDNDQVEKHLKKIHVEWAVVSGTTLSRVYEFEDFRSALGFVVKVGELAEKADHHPDLELSWGKVVVNITTHAENGLTQLDFDLAAQIDKL